MAGSLWKSLTALVVVLVVGYTGWSWWAVQRSAPAFYLLTPAEAAQFAALPDINTRGLRVTRSDGPDIRFASPNGDTLTSPVNIDVSLAARDGVAVDMKSILIEYKIGPAWINVTGRIMKQASVKGTRLYARGADLPSGRHMMRLTVNDSQARTTQAVVSFSVR